MLLIFLFFSVYFILNRKSVAGGLSVLVVSSVLSGFLIHLDVQMKGPADVFNVGLTVLILLLFIAGFKDYATHSFIVDGRHERLLSLFKFIFIGSMIAIVINLFIILSSINNLMQLSISIEAYKNQKIAQEFLASSVPMPLRALTAFLSPLSYLALGYHFYFMIVKDRRRSLLAFIASFNIFLVTLFVIGRGGVVSYILLYIFYWIYSYGALDKNFKNKVRNLFIFTLVFIGSFFIFISIDRFTVYSHFSSGSLVENQFLYSLLHYLSQWIENGMLLLDGYEYEKNLSASTIRYLPNKVLSMLGYTIIPIQELRIASFGELASAFNGLPAILVYDFGYVGSIIFAFTCFLIVRSFAPKNRLVLPSNFILFSLLIPAPLFFFQGSYFIFSMYNIAILFGIVFYFSFSSSDQELCHKV